MRELQQKQKRKRRLYSLPALFLLLIVALLLVRGAYGVVMKERESKRYVKELEEKHIELSRRSEMLEQNIARLQTDEGIDEEIKEKYGVSREGERVAVIVDPQPEETVRTEGVHQFFGRFWDVLSRLWR